MRCFLASVGSATVDGRSQASGWKQSGFCWELSPSQAACGGSGSRKRRRPNLRSVSATDVKVSKDKPIQNMSELGDLRIHGLGHCSESGARLRASSTSRIGKSELQSAVESTRLGCPVYVMLPLDTIRVDERNGTSEVKKESELVKALHKFRSAGVSGIMVDVWWGIVEREGPKQYDLSGYRRLFKLVSDAGLKIQAVMSFHAAGGNVGDTCEIHLPSWVLDVGIENPDIFYTDRQGFRNKECLSLGCDEEKLFWGRTPIEMYGDFVEAFMMEFRELCGEVITEITVGMGPAGELRYPSYPEGDGRWCFPGVGEFQCYDKYMLQKLKVAAAEIGQPEWGLSGPHDAGHYNSKCWETEFFNCHSGNFDMPYGKFFLSWYSGLLIQHAEMILSTVSEVMKKMGHPQFCKSMRTMQEKSVLIEFDSKLKLGVKCAGVHWWFKTRAHAAELTAGYYNTRDRDGYGPIMDVLKKYNAHMSFTCVEMRDCEHPPESMCSPQGLLQQIIGISQEKGLPISGENALQRYDEYAFSRIAESAFGQNARAGRLEQLTFLRMGCLMFDNWMAFSSFLERMRCPPLDP